LLESSESTVRYSSRLLGQHYLIDVINMTQTNTSTLTKRRVRRLILDGEGKITDASSLSEPSYPYHPPSLLETDTFVIHQRQKSSPPDSRLTGRDILGCIPSKTKKIQSKSKERKEMKSSPNYRGTSRRRKMNEQKKIPIQTSQQPPFRQPLSIIQTNTTIRSPPLRKHERERRLAEKKRALSKERQISNTPEKKKHDYLMYYLLRLL